MQVTWVPLVVVWSPPSAQNLKGVVPPRGITAFSNILFATCPNLKVGGYTDIIVAHNGLAIFTVYQLEKLCLIVISITIILTSCSGDLSFCYGDIFAFKKSCGHEM